MIHQIFYKTHTKVNSVVINKDQLFDFDSDDFWVHNDLCTLKNEDKNILTSKDARLVLWLYNWCRPETYLQSTRKWFLLTVNFKFARKKCKLPSRPATQGNIQLLHDECHHWLLSFRSNSPIQLCDSFKCLFNSRITKIRASARYKKIDDDDWKIITSFLLVQKQANPYNCSLFAIALATEVLDSKSPVNAVFDVPEYVDTLDLMSWKSRLGLISQS